MVTLKQVWNKYCEALEQCGDNLSGSRTQLDDEAVHKLRTSSRRLVALIDLLPKNKKRQRLKKQIRVPFRTLGEFRDYHIQEKLLDDVVSKDDHELKKLYYDHIQDQRQKLQKEAKKLIKKSIKDLKDQKTGMKKVYKTLQKKKLFSNEDRQKKAIQRVIEKKLLPAFEKSNPTTPATLHPVRIGFKKVRYAFEAVDKKTDELKDLQDRFGQIQDFQALLNEMKKLNHIDPNEIAHTQKSIEQKQAEIANKAVEDALIVLDRLKIEYQFETPIQPELQMAKSA